MLSYWFLRLIEWTLGRIPEALLTRVRDVVCFWVFTVFRYRRSVMKENLRRAFPNASDADREVIERDAQKHLVSVLLDLFQIRKMIREGWEHSVDVRFMERIEEACTAGKGVLMITGHLGSFEYALAASVLRLRPLSVAVVVKSFSGGFDRYLNEVRQAAGLRVIRAKEGLGPMLEHLRGGGVLACVVDQNSTRSQGVFVDFFGEEACTMAGPAILARRAKAEFLGVGIRRVGKRHELEISEIQAPSTCTTLTLTQAFARFVEEEIRKAPSQWLWTHKRWRTRPKPQR